MRYARRLRVFGVAAIAILTLHRPQAQQSAGAFARTGSMTVPRGSHTATLLRNGKVLIAGGQVHAPNDYRGANTATAELFDPATGTFSATGSMSSARSWHTATLLPDGKVLIVGGEYSGVPLPDDPRTSAELYDPATERFTRTGSPIGLHLGGITATLLTTGKVLIAGGVSAYCCGRPPVANPELYDPATGTFATTGAFVGPGDVYYQGGPNSPTAVLLRDGRVLFTGEPYSEIYDPSTGAFSESGVMTTLCAPTFHVRPSYISGRTATLLGDGKVLVTGGGNEDCGRFANTEIFEPASGTFQALAAMHRRRVLHTATALSDGTVLITGGESESASSLVTEATAEIYDPATRTMTLVGTMSGGREAHTATRLQDGRVLVAGGEFYADVGVFLGSLNSADIFTPAATAAPVLVFPAESATTENLHPRLQVHNVAARGSALYRFEWSQRQDFVSGETNVADLIAQGSGGDTAYEISERLLPDTRYYWRARAAVQPASGQSGVTVTGPYSETRSFRTTATP